MKNYKNFSFDVGMTSLGVAVNENGEIIHGDVLLMHPDAGSVKKQAERRRQFRTREAHKAREAVLEALWRSIGKEPLQRKRFRKTKNAKGKREFIKTTADNRLEREFPGKGDDTVYTSCLLRIMLLEGQPLEDWQIYKALHAGIQRRGYDSNVPWKTRGEQQKESAKDENPEEQVNRFNAELKEMTSDVRYHLPAYYDAWMMGLWDAKTGKVVHIRQPRRSPEKGKDRARGYNSSRELTTKEIRKLLTRAGEQIPELREHLTEGKVDQLLYGTQHNAMDKRYPSATKIEGVLGQKYPRFENRIVSKCALIHRLNVCKAEKPLAIEVGFLLRLVNWRYEKVDEQSRKSVHSLTGEQLAVEFEKCKLAWKKKSQAYKPEEYAKCFRLTEGKVTKMAENLGGYTKEGHTKIPASKHTGRSRFSQPALYLMKSLILSEKTPKEYYDELMALVASKEKENPGAEFGYQLFPDVSYKYHADYFQFLEKMGDTRDSIHVPDISLAERYFNEDGDVESAIQKVIGTCNWPELRHRLNVFHRKLEELIEKYGKPDAVHLEFIREDFLSEKKKKKYTDQANAGKEKRQKASEELKGLNIETTEKNILRYRLYEEQNNICIYTGDAIDSSRLEDYDIDHIFPQEDGGPDAYYNKVLTSAEVNRNQKGKRLPCECECDFINWADFKSRLKGLPLGKKKLLLASTREEAEELIEKYTGLSGTAHIARLARDIVCLQFGWQPGAKGEQQRVFVFSGGLTSKVAKKYKLYTALGDGSDKYKKDREDHRHHALDAMVISYLRQWARDKSKTDFFKFPPGVDAKYFDEKLSEVNPRYITKIQAAIAEQPKPQRKSGEKKSDVSAREFKNISKDPDERGQWYTNKSETGKGTYQHGYLFYRDDKGKVCSQTIHSFRSPYAVKKEVEKKSSEILGLFYVGKSIRLPAQGVTATQLGRKARLKYGEYEIAKLLTKEAVIRQKNQQHEQSENIDPTDDRYRIALSRLKRIQICNNLVSSKLFELAEFPESKDNRLTGNYRVDNSTSELPNKCIITNIQTGEQKSVRFFRLVKYLDEENWGDDLKVKGVIGINNIHRTYIEKAEMDDLPGQNLPEGHYQIKGFDLGGSRVQLTSQNGTIYRIASKVLALAV